MLQKNVLEYLEASASRVPDKVAFSDEAEAFTFAQLQSAAKSMGTALAQRSARKKCAGGGAGQPPGLPIWPPVSVLYMREIFYVPLDSQMPLPRAAFHSGTLSPCRPWYMTRRRRRPPKP